MELRVVGLILGAVNLPYVYWVGRTLEKVKQHEKFMESYENFTRKFMKLPPDKLEKLGWLIIEEQEKQEQRDRDEEAQSRHTEFMRTRKPLTEEEIAEAKQRVKQSFKNQKT